MGGRIWVRQGEKKVMVRFRGEIMRGDLLLYY